MGDMQRVRGRPKTPHCLTGMTAFAPPNVAQLAIETVVCCRSGDRHCLWLWYGARGCGGLCNALSANTHHVEATTAKAMAPMLACSAPAAFGNSLWLVDPSIIVSAEPGREGLPVAVVGKGLCPCR